MNEANGNTTDESPLSLRRITTAFAAMLGRSASESGDRAEAAGGQGPSTQSIVEALLFVGMPDDGPLSSEQVAATMRDVSPEQVETTVDELNRRYATEGSALHIDSSAGGYRLALRQEFEELRLRYLGRAKATTLSPAALEVLSVVAYRQPVDPATVDRLRDARSYALLSQLVRRGLVSREGAESPRGTAVYCTTQRFLTLFGIDTVDQLPRAEEFDLPELPADGNDQSASIPLDEGSSREAGRAA